MQHVASATCLAWAVLLTGCAPEDDSFGRQSTVLLEAGGSGGAATDGAPIDDRPLDDGDAAADDASTHPDAALAAFDDQGNVVAVDPRDGRVVARSDLASDFGPELEPVDLVVDAPGSRIVAVVRPPPFEESLIVEIPLEADGELGAARRLGRVGGDARVMPIAGGIVVASNEDGPRVRLMRDDGARTQGRPLPEPLTWWSAEHGTQIEGLGSDANRRLVTFRLEVGATGSIEVVEREFVGSTSEDARLVRELRAATGTDEHSAPARLVVHDDDTGELRIGDLRVGDFEGETLRTLAFGARALEGAVRWGGVVAITTRFPDLLVVADRDTESAVPLPGGVRAATPFGRHDLVVLGETLYVATAGGVVTFQRPAGDVSVAGGTPALPGKHLRGPLAVLTR